jgi:alginate O-acetyltransferase complex protein AlgJ
MNKLLILMLSFAVVFLPLPIFGVYTQNKIFSYSIFNYSYSLYLLGISSDSNKTIIGNNGWLFLGNNSSSVMDKSKSSYKIAPKALSANEVFINELYSISKKANSDFKFIVAPNKHSIYGEHLGLDSNVGAYSYYNNNANPVRSDMVSYIREIKTKTSNDLYFKTDTHWNGLGAFYGYQYIMKYTLSNYFEKIPDTLEFNDVEIKGGDLARFLGAENFIVDKNISVLELIKDRVVRINLTTDAVSTVDIQGDINNNADIKQPIKIVNSNALNNLNVLWIHDSFGQAMSPYMHLTFREVTHQHYRNAFKNMSNFRRLVEEVKPDIIILFVIERNSLNFGN